MAVTLNFIQGGNHATINSEHTGSNWVIKITADNDYKLYNVGVNIDDGAGGSMWTEFTINEDRTEATATIWGGVNENYNVSGYSVYYPRYKPADAPINMAYEFIPRRYDSTEGYINGYWDITVTSNEGFIIEQIYTQVEDTSLGYQYHEFVVSDDGLTASFKTSSFTHMYMEADISYFGGSWTVKTAPSGGNETVGGEYGSIYVYSITMDELEQFARKRFYWGDLHPVTDPDVWDLGIFVNKIIRLHTDVPVNDEQVQLICADFNTEILVNTPSVSTVSLDFGSVEIPAYNGDAVDMQSVVEVFVPFVGLVSLSSDYIGLEVQMICDIDVITGDGVVKFLHDGVPFQFNSLQPFTNIIYRLVNKNNTSVGEYPFSSFVLYGLEPYVLVKWYESSNPDSINASVKRGVLSSFEGFNSFQYISGLNDEQMLTSEQEMIISALYTGVYIE